jgi:TolB-like protein/tRNA A-37 threonylcarbamoyl transferase component Bud32/Flp pilus assembly protein TadD
VTSDQPAEERLTTALSGRYRIESEIGSGGMATVYLAQDLKHDRKVAVKVLKPELAAVLGAERFLSEIKTTANLQHPHILPLFDSGEADGFLFYVMPYVAGESLRTRLDREKQLSVDEAVGITRSVANALDYAHRNGVIHRDVKPANILLHDGQPLVADFGIALAVQAAGGPRLTETGLSLGTPHYMSPEQASGDREIDGRSDLYSLGAVLYEMLAGETPHSGPTVQAVIAKLLTERPRSVKELRETVPDHLSATVQRALAKLPADRFESTESFAKALMEDRRIPARQPSDMTANSRRPLWIGLAAAVVVVLITAWWTVAQDRAGNRNIERVAVLPPENLTGDPEQDFFLEGMHDRLIAVLGQVLRNDVAVLGGRSVMQYRDSDLPTRDIAEELDVDALIELSMARSGDSAYVTAHLVRAVSGTVEGSVTHERALPEIMALYEDVAYGIAEELRKVAASSELNPSGAEWEEVATPSEFRPTVADREVDPEAYALYLRGERYYNRLDPIEGDLYRAISYYEFALEEDSTFSPAYAGISRAYAILGAFSRIPPDSAWPRMETAADLAMQYGEELVEVRLAHAQRLFYGWDFTGARRVLENLYESNPNDVEVVSLFSSVLAHLGERERAVQLVRRGQALEPRDPLTLSRLAWALVTARQWPEVFDLYERVLSDWPEYVLAHNHLTEAYTAAGDLERAVEHQEANLAAMDELETANEHGMIGFLYGRLGREAEAREQLVIQDDIERAGRYVSPIARSLVYLGLGDEDTALTLLEEAYATHAGWMNTVMVSPYWDSLRSHPRFQALQRKVNLPMPELR